MRRIRFFIAAFFISLVVFSNLSCGNNVLNNPIDEAEEKDIEKFGSVSASIFVPDYQKMSKNTRVVSPQTAKVRFSYVKGGEWVVSETLDIDTASLEQIDGAPSDLPGGIWKGTFGGIPVGNYAAGKMKVELLDKNGEVISAGTNASVTSVISGENAKAAFYTTPVNVSPNGALKQGQMLFWKFTMMKGYVYKFSVTAEGTYPDIVLFNENGTFNKYISVDSSDDVPITLDACNEETVFYVGIYADDGDVESYSLKVECEVPDDAEIPEFSIDFETEKLPSGMTIGGSGLDGVTPVIDIDDGVLVIDTAAMREGDESYIMKTIVSPVDMDLTYKVYMETLTGSGKFRVYVDDKIAAEYDGRDQEWKYDSVTVPKGEHTVKFNYEKTSNYYSHVLENVVKLDDIILSKLITYSTISEDFEGEYINSNYKWIGNAKLTSAVALGEEDDEDFLHGQFVRFSTLPWVTSTLKLKNIVLEEDSVLSFKFFPNVCTMATITFSVLVDGDELLILNISFNNTWTTESIVIPTGNHTIEFVSFNSSDWQNDGTFNSVFLDDIVLKKSESINAEYSTISEDFEGNEIDSNYNWTGSAKLTSADALGANKYEFDGMTGKFAKLSTLYYTTSTLKLKNIAIEEESSLSFKYYPSVCSMATITFSVLVDDKVVWCDEYPAYNNYNLVLASVNIPAGNHTIEFVAANDSGWHNDGTYNSIFLDDIYLVPDVIAGIKVTPRAKQETYIGCKDYQKIIAKAYAVRADGSVKEDAVVNLSSDCGTIDENGVFTPTKVGTTKIVATCGEFTGESGEITVYDTDYMQKPYTYNGKTYNGIDISTASVPIAPHSDDYSTIEITYPQYSTFEADGFFTLEGSVINQKTYNYICVDVRKDGSDEDCTYYILRDDFKRRIWLRFGEGDYTITIWNLSSISLSAALGADGDFYHCNYSSCAQEFHVKNTRSEFFGDSPDGRWLYPSDVVQADDLLVTNTANEILYDLPEDATDTQKIKVIHDFIVGSNYYDEESLIDGYRKKQDAVSVLLNGTCVCEGYANSVAAFARYAGIPVKVIKGMGFNGVSAEFHAWNNIYMNDKWLFLDATWDDPLPDSGIYYTYFLLEDLGGIDDDHYEYFDVNDRSIIATPRIPEWRGTPGGWY